MGWVFSMKANEVHSKGVSKRSFGKSGGGVIEASLREGALVVYQGWCRPAFFTCIPTQWARLIFIGEKLVLEKSESPLFYFILKEKIKQERKP